MGKRYMARRGTWRCGGLQLRNNHCFEIGVGDLPEGFQSWEDVEALLERHADKNDLYFEVPNIDELQAQKPAAPQAPVADDGPPTLYVCPYCNASFEGIVKLREHMDECPELVKTGHFEDAGVQTVEPLSVPDEAEEIAAGEAEAKIREAQAEAEAKAKAEKKEKNAKTYGKKSGGLSAKADAARKAAKAKKAKDVEDK